jgi:cation diffusion facilitator CzcD-associated flavoprotein CzcO
MNGTAHNTASEHHDASQYDVIIIGAGLSGINAAYRVQTQAPKGTTYTILETRSNIGGTWDLFKYPVHLWISMAAMDCWTCNCASPAHP